MTVGWKSAPAPGPTPRLDPRWCEVCGRRADRDVDIVTDGRRTAIRLRVCPSCALRLAGIDAEILPEP